MIKRCRHCERFYWRYRPDHPPRFYCSIPCWDARGTSKPAAVPRTPRVILAELRHHLRIFHDTDSILAAFDDCAGCEELEALYSESLSWYMEHPEQPADPARTPEVLRRQRKRIKQAPLIAQAGGQ